MPLLILAFIIVPLAELAVIVKVSHLIGLVPTLVFLLTVSVVGAWLAKREGLSVLSRFKAQLSAGSVPGAELVDGVLVIVAGALLLTPGFITDATALVLLLPPVRASVRKRLRRTVEKRLNLGKFSKIRRVVGDQPPTTLPPQ